MFSVPTTGGTTTMLAADTSGDLGPVVGCGSAICWASAIPVGESQLGTGSLMQFDPSGGVTTLSQGPGFYSVYRLLFDGSSFYATTIGCCGDTGEVERLAGAGGSPVTVGSGSGLAVDDDCLYTGDALFGVYSIAKASAGQ